VSLYETDLTANGDAANLLADAHNPKRTSNVMEYCTVAHSSFSNPVTFGEIARLAEELKISEGISSPLREGNDMIKAQTLAGEAFHASAAVTLPDFALD
jgi:hypothetical protein